MNKFECIHLNYFFGTKKIFKDFSFSFEAPGIVFLEGENGVGKSTALKLFAGLIISTDGTILYNGKSIDALIKGEFSYFTTTSLGLLSELTGREHIELVAKSLQIDENLLLTKINHFKKIEIFNEILAKEVGEMSQGMRQLLRLFLHLIPNASIYFLDEPFLYLSPSIKDFIQKHLEILAQTSCVFITDQKISWIPNVKSEKILLGQT